MSITFSASELINIAIGNERKRNAFYDDMTRTADSASARGVYQNLPNKDREHIQIINDRIVMKVRKTQIVILHVNILTPSRGGIGRRLNRAT